MAFGNIFKSIDFSAPNRQAQMEANNFQALIGQAVKGYQDQKRREEDIALLKYKEQARPKDPMKIAKNAFLKYEQGLPLNDEDKASISFALKTDRPSVYQDPETMAMVTRPGEFSQYSGALGGLVGGASPVVTESGPQPLPGMGARREQAMAENIARMRGDDLETVDMTQEDVEFALSGSAPTTLPPVRQAEVDQDAAKVFAEGTARQKLKVQSEKFDEFIINSKNIPLVEQMIKFNEGTVDLPFAEMIDPAAKLLSPEQADNLSLLRQNQLELAAPLAKALGVNPTDKDFEASLRRIVDLNSTKTGRKKQLNNILKRMKERSGQAPYNEGQTATDPKTGVKMIFKGGKWQTM